MVTLIYTWATRWTRATTDVHTQTH